MNLFKKVLKALGLIVAVWVGTVGFLALTALVTGDLYESQEKKPAKPVPAVTESLAAPMPLIEETKEQVAGPVITPVVKKTSKIKRLTLYPGKVATLLGEVNYASVESTKGQLMVLENTADEIYLLIDSPGGSVFDGSQILTVIDNSKVPVHTVCIGTCASMAAMIFSHGKTRLMVDRAILMYHGAAGGVSGDVKKMLSLLSFIDNFIKKQNTYTAGRAGMSVEELERIEDRELWLDGEDAVAMKLADGLVSLHLPYAFTFQMPQSTSITPVKPGEKSDNKQGVKDPTEGFKLKEAASK